MGVRPHVVVIGAGFGGLAVARGLARAPVEITLVDRHNFTTFQPLLYQVATAGLNAADVAHPVRGLLQRQPNVSFRQGEVTGVDWERRHVLLDGPARPRPHPHMASAPPRPSHRDDQRLAFDHLVLAVGAVTTWLNIPGAVENALPLYTLDDAAEVRNQVIERFEAADADSQAADADSQADDADSQADDGTLTFVVVGGGPTGVEMAGALAELFAVVFRRDYPRLDLTRARVVLVEALDTLLGAFHDSSRRHAAATLANRGVEVRLGEPVAEIAPDHVRFGSGEVLATRTVIWAAGVRAHPLAEALGLETGRGGRVVVGDDLAVPGHDGVWAIGDVAAPPDRRGGVLPQLAPVAMQTGAHVAQQIQRAVVGKPTQPFRFADRGIMATIGRHAAVAELPGRVRLHGPLAWVAWLGLHLLYLAGFRNRASVLLNWAWGYLTWDRGPRIILRSNGRARRRTPA